jgi:hypothetical protein
MKRWESWVVGAMLALSAGGLAYSGAVQMALHEDAVGIGMLASAALVAIATALVSPARQRAR